MRRTRGRRGLVGVLLALLLTSCTVTEPPPAAPPIQQPTSAAPSPRRSLTVGTTERYATADPAAAVTSMSTSLALNVFQRLMTVPTGKSVLKPDAARDCIVKTPTTYVCTLTKGLTFHNGHRLTSSDVKFSIERARRLDVADTSTPLLASIETIDTPDPETVIFRLSRVDTQIGFALASPAASIVDEQLYPANKLQPREQGVLGSGPYLVSDLDGGVVSFTRFGRYKGPHPGGQPKIAVQRFANSGELENAMTDRSVDVVWRGLSGSALSRLREQESTAPAGDAAGYVSQTLPGARVTRLLWNPKSPHRINADLRAAITNALQADRTLASIVPASVEGHLPTFAAGGAGGVNITWPEPIPLAMRYDPSTPDSLDVANQIKTRLEAAEGIAVTLEADLNADADLVLTDRPAWNWTALSWAEPYTEDPAIGSVVRVDELVQQCSTAVDIPGRDLALAELQKQAAADQVVLPVSQSDEQLFLAEGITITPNGLGPSWQLGLWGFNR